MRVYESLRPNESETVELVATGYTAGYAIEHIRVVGQTRARDSTPIDSNEKHSKQNQSQ